MILVFFASFGGGKDNRPVRKDDFECCLFSLRIFDWASINRNVKEIISSLFDFFKE
jgi:hypothetical protein